MKGCIFEANLGEQLFNILLDVFQISLESIKLLSGGNKKVTHT